jgi:exonuclease III
MLDLEKDKYGGNPASGGNTASGDTGALHLKKLIQRFDLVDIWRKQHPTDRQFTWQTKRGSIKCRLDRFYFSASLVRDYDVEIDIMVYPYSDHDLVRVLLTVDKASSNVAPVCGS